MPLNVSHDVARLVPMLTIPTRGDLRAHPIVTPRLLLGPVEPTDASELYERVEASRTTLEPWLSWVPFQTDVASSLRYAEASASDWDYGRALRFTLRDKKTKELGGVVSLESLQHLHLSCDLGYWLRHDWNGSGLMTEAASAAVAFAFGTLGAHRVRVAAATQNHRSLAVIGRLGFRFEGIGRHCELIAGRWLDHAIYAKLSTDA